jgi:hypothetical protein
MVIFYQHEHSEVLFLFFAAYVQNINFSEIKFYFKNHKIR